MLCIVEITRGIGNQMFGYAFYLYLKKMYKPAIIEFDNTDCRDHHNGFELNNVFPGIKVRNPKYIIRLRKIYKKYITRVLFIHKYKEHNNDYLRISFPLFYVFHGFWQSEKYVRYNNKEIHKLFEFDTNKLNNSTKSVLKIMKKTVSVSIHVRRGDYLHNAVLGGICDDVYYEKALEVIRLRTINPEFYVFTDDKEWVRSNFNITDYTLIDWNTANESWQDMYLMSHCKHNIIANSTFSWWGAWLNKNPDKVVIAPNKWKNSRLCTDIVPSNWIKI